jgi:hypothetical protein
VILKAHPVSRPNVVRAGIVLGATTAAVLLMSGHAHAATIAGQDVVPGVSVTVPGGDPSPVGGIAGLVSAVPTPLTSGVPAVSSITTTVSHVVPNLAVPALPAVHSPVLAVPVVSSLASLLAGTVAQVGAVAEPTVTSVANVVAPLGLSLPSEAATIDGADDVPLAGTIPAPALRAAAQVVTVRIDGALPRGARLAPAVPAGPHTPAVPATPLAPAVPTAPVAPVGGGTLAGAGHGLATVALLAGAALAAPFSSRLVRRVRTDGSSAFMVSIVEWPG